MGSNLDRLRVIATQTVTYITLVGVVLGIVIEELAPYDDNPAVAWAVRVAGSIVAAGTVAALIIRRVSEVPIKQRGILPQP